MKAIASIIALALVACVAPTGAEGPTVREGGMEYRHEKLGGRHILTVRDRRMTITTRTESMQTMTIFAYRFAARVCPNGYDFERDPAFDDPEHEPVAALSKTFIFVERH